MRVPFMPQFDAWDGAVFDAGDSERVEPLDEFFGLGQELEQRRREHVARPRPFRSLCIRPSFYFTPMWFIMLAR